MAELSKGEARLLLARLDTNYRVQQQRIATRNAPIVRNLVAGSVKQGSNDAERARMMRRGLVAVLEPAGETSSSLASVYYNQARAIYEASSPKSSRFQAEPSAIHKAKDSLIIVERAFTGLGFQIGQAVEGKKSWGSVLGSATEAITQGVLNYGRGTIMENAKRDGSAEGYKRSLDASGGCDFCMLLAAGGVNVDADFDGWHLFCSCTAAPVFEGSIAFMDSPAVDDILAEREAAKERLQAKRTEIGYNDMKRNKRPAELALTTQNILKEIRELRTEKR